MMEPTVAAGAKKFSPQTSSRLKWNNAEKSLVATECVRLFPKQTKKFTASHFKEGQRVLVSDRRKGRFSKLLIQTLRRLISDRTGIGEIPENQYENTDAVHDGSFDTVVVDEPEEKSKDIIPPAITQPSAPATSEVALPKPTISAPSESAERIVAMLVDINLKSLALKGFTARQIEEAMSNKIDSARIRNLTIQANNSLTYFEEIARLGCR